MTLEKYKTQKQLPYYKYNFIHIISILLFIDYFWL